MARTNQKDWDNRFRDEPGTPAPVKRGLTRAAVLVAASYWLSVFALFFALEGFGVDIAGPGALPVIAYTAPWSLGVVLVQSNMAFDGNFAEMAAPLGTSSPLETFLVAPLLCGGLNALSIAVIWSLIQKKFGAEA